MAIRNGLAVSVGILVILFAAAALPAQDFVTSPMPFLGITPCRIADTRDAGMPGGYGPPSLAAGAPRNFVIAGQCGIPVGARAVSLNVTVVNPAGFGYVLLYPFGDPQPLVSTLNYVPGLTVANAAIVPLGLAGGITVAAAVSGTDFLIDTNGYYAPSAVEITDTFVGLGAGNTTTPAFHDTGFGYGALMSNTTGAENTAFGAYALTNNQDGSNNTAFGASALAANTSGFNNSAFGAGALASNTTGSNNVAVGAGALGSNVGGSQNTAVGGYALAASTGSYNTALGYGAGLNLTAGDSNVYVGNAGGSVESNTLRIGEPGFQTRFFLAGVFGVTPQIPDAIPVFVDSNGQVGTIVSSARFKQDVRDLGEESHSILRLRPVSFRYNGQSAKHYGLVAEEVAEVLPELVVSDAAGEPEAVLYHELPAMLLNELQGQRRQIEALDDLDRRLEERLREDESGDAQERELGELRSWIARREAGASRQGVNPR